MIGGMMRAAAHPTAAIVAAVMAFALWDAATATTSAASPSSTAETAAVASVAHPIATSPAQLSPAQIAALETSPEARRAFAQRAVAAETSAWWESLGPSARAELVRDAPALVGGLDGVAPLDRVAANRTLALHRVAAIDRLQRATARGAGADADRAALARERQYLMRVIRGTVRLYLYDRDGGALVEMAGDPSTATGILFVVPGTNATMDSFMVDDPVSSFATWQARNADPSKPILAFTVLAAPMPQISLDLAAGPQNNTIATAAGADYARIVRGIDVAFPGLPTLSYEHSAGSAVGSAAEMHGARFDARFLAAGVGATDGYETVAGTAYYASQATEDVNRYYAGFQVGDVGYGVGPEEFRGITIVDPGFTEDAPSAGGAMLWRGLDLHNRLFSGDETSNGTVLRDVRLLLASLSHESSG